MVGAMETPGRKPAPVSAPPLPGSFYARATDEVARDLIGRVLVHDAPEGLTAGRIVETEAYFGPGDPASHAHRGPTPRSSIMFGHPGIAYVYFTYGMYHLLNAVTEDHGKAGAVLIRALAPVQGQELMRARHVAWRAARNRTPPAHTRDTDLADGPGKLTIAMGIDLAQNGQDLTGEKLFITRGEPVADLAVAVSPRIGIRQGTEHELRFFVKGDPHVSKG